MITGDITKTSSITDSEIPRDAVLLAQRLAQRHGNVRITMEEGGIHLYMASPECLKRYGEEELSKMQLLLNCLLLYFFVPVIPYILSVRRAPFH